MKSLTLKAKKNNYRIYVGNNVLSNLPELIVKKRLSQRIFVIIDSNVKLLHESKIFTVLNKFKPEIFYYEFKAKEKNKTLSEAYKIYRSLLSQNYGRDTLIIAIGGGITGDVAAFVASTYMRGVELIQIPTTLMAAIDSSIGGKTGVNLERNKNIISTFYPPEFVLTDTSFLKTLTNTGIRSGMGEIIKYALLSDLEFFNFVNTHFNLLIDLDSKAIEKTIIKCIEIKKSIVEKDEQEKSTRKILNLGHTFGHAIESSTDFKVSHGESVAAGIICSLLLAENCNFISKKRSEYLMQLPLRLTQHSLLSSINADDVLRFMESDKKKRKSIKRFILPVDIGKMLIDFEARDNQIINVMTEFKSTIRSKHI